jgi:MinD superfamily P-loop ATPase
MPCSIVCAVRIIADESIPMGEISRKINEDSLELVGAVEAEQGSGTCRDREPEI